LLGSVPGAREVERAVPWEPDPAQGAAAARDPDAGGRVGALLGEERVAELLRARRDAILSHPVRARSRPDVLVVHVESMRADMLRAEVAPTLTALAKDAIAPAHHLTTGTNTGTGVFGILHGLLSPYYAFARREHFRPLPLEILRALGYRLSL